MIVVPQLARHHQQGAALGLVAIRAAPEVFSRSEAVRLRAVVVAVLGLEP